MRRNKHLSSRLNNFFRLLSLSILIFSFSNGAFSWAEDQDFNLACQRWLERNSSVQSGTINIERFRGSPQTRATVLDQLEDNGIIFTAYFKAGVTAYEKAKDEYYVLFHPEDKYHWPTVLKKSGSYLLIGTRGEGLVIVNLRQNYLKKIKLPSPYHEVHTIETSDSAIKINNSHEINLSQLQ